MYRLVVTMRRHYEQGTLCMCGHERREHTLSDVDCSVLYCSHLDFESEMDPCYCDGFSPDSRYPDPPPDNVHCDVCQHLGHMHHYEPVYGKSTMREDEDTWECTTGFQAWFDWMSDPKSDPEAPEPTKCECRRYVLPPIVGPPAIREPLQNVREKVRAKWDS